MLARVSDSLEGREGMVMATDPLALDFGRDKRFCVYIYRDPRPRWRREPFYVGKGLTKIRPDIHWIFAFFHRSNAGQVGDDAAQAQLPVSASFSR